MNEETSKEHGLLKVRSEALDPQHSVQARGDVGHSSLASRQFTTVVIDEEPQVAPELSKPGKPKRRRGRPPGAKTLAWLGVLKFCAITISGANGSGTVDRRKASLLPSQQTLGAADHRVSMRPM